MYIPLTVNIPELLSVPTMFSASHVYVPTSDDIVFTMIIKLSIVDSSKGIDKLTYLDVSDKFTIILLKYHLKTGTGSPVA